MNNVNLMVVLVEKVTRIDPLGTAQNVMAIHHPL